MPRCGKWGGPSFISKPKSDIGIGTYFIVLAAFAGLFMHIVS